MALEARPDLTLLRLHISDPARYYHGERAIVVRTGLLLAEERRYLWHELVHADRGDEACHSSDSMEHSVDREAARRAMPLCSLEWAAGRSASWAEFADLLKMPELFVRFRMRTAHPTERAHVQAVAQSAELEASGH